MKYYYSEQFEHCCEIPKFLSRNHINKDDIIQIYADKYYHYIIFMSDDEYFYDNYYDKDDE